MKKVPLRTCIVTKEKLDKRDLIRIVKDKEGHISIDLTGKANGRGVYLKKDLNAILKAPKYLSKALESEIDPEIYEELEKLVK